MTGEFSADGFDGPDQLDGKWVSPLDGGKLDLPPSVGSQYTRALGEAATEWEVRAAQALEEVVGSEPLIAGVDTSRPAAYDEAQHTLRATSLPTNLTDTWYWGDAFFEPEN